jgi:hypothetical protein
MGYNTRHMLTIDGEIDEEIIADLRATCEDAGYALEENGEPADSCKWYDADKHLKAFSLKYPEKVFCLHGEGEEAADVWNTYYRNGKMQHCPAIITFEPFDESKLK